MNNAGIPVQANGEIADGLLASTEEALKILQGKAQKGWIAFRLFAYSESLFTDDQWICWNQNDPKALQVQRGKWIINWKTHPLPQQMLEELKRLTWTRFVVTGSIPFSIGIAKCTIHFLSQLVSDIESKELYLNSLSDLNLANIRKGLFNTNISRLELETTVKNQFIFMAQPPVCKYVGFEVNWNEADINNLPWKHYNKEDFRRGPRIPLSSELFLYRSNLNRALVRDFLEALGENPEDTDRNPIYEKWLAEGALLSQRYPDSKVFAGLYQAYIDTCDRPKDRKRQHWHFEYCEANKKAFPRKTNRMKRGQMGGFIRKARYAAMQSISIYTGMRESELKGIHQPLGATGKKRCIRCDHGRWFLYSTVAKNNPDGAAVGTHRWVAPVVIRDAIRVLELQQPINKNPYLFSGFGGMSINDRPYATPAASIYVNAIMPHFSGTKWEDELRTWTIHTDRHTLVKELDAAGVQLVHISRQLQHLHMMLTECEGSEVTLGYGGIGERTIKTNPDLQKCFDSYREQVKRERYHAVLGENAVLAGPGSEAIKRNIDAKFQGMGIFGEDRKNYIDGLVDAGFPLPTSGFGICGQSAFDMEDEPPCMGDYECDPNCMSCIVTSERTYQAINEFRRAIGMQLSENQELNRPYWEKREGIFTKILTQLGEKPNEIKEKYLTEHKVA